MRPIASRSIAAASALLAVGTLAAARRPRYGGTLRVEMRAAVQNLDPAQWPADPGEAEAKAKLVAHVFETLVQLDQRGEPQPWLAASWTHDAARKRWVFTPRPNVMLHNGALWEPPGGVIAVPADRPIEQILRDLARPRNAVVVRSSDGTLAGTGPFRVAKWEPGQAATLAAHDTYWAGRPYLDAVVVQMGRAWRDQALDLELDKADLVEIPVTELRRLQQRGASVTVSAPVETLALLFDRPVADAVREALALSIDRAAIHNVLLRRQGEISAALLPQWLSGYAFLFSAERNLARARQLVSGATLSFAYDRQDAALRAVAERIAINASEAGLSLRPAAAAADVRLARLPITAPDPWLALEDMAAVLKVAIPPAPANPYEFERALVDSSRVIPLFHLPAAYQAGTRVRSFTGARWRLEDVWLDSR